MAGSGVRSSAAELLLRVDRSSRLPLRVQVEQGLRDQIRTGVLPPGTILPSSRVLSRDLGVSRRLVVEVYEQLTAEGYLSAHPRSATRVAALQAGTGHAPDAEPPPARFDLRPGLPALGEFPRAAWLHATAHVLRHTPTNLLAYPDPRGVLPLRRAVADYLRRVRAVVVDPERVVICSGFTQALSLLTGVLGAPVVALEDPGVVGRDKTVATAGGHHLALPVDDHGARVDLLPASDARMAVVSPAHQFPLGVTLAASRRTELLAWAAESGGIIAEDDYDAEFRYDRQPVGALQGLAPEHVVYMGTTSKTLAPALRLGWMVPPYRLLEPITHAKHSQDAGNPVIEQLTFAHLLQSGAYERHLRRMRRQYHQRRKALLTALNEHLPAAKISGAAAGLHIVLTLPGKAPAAAIIDTAETSWALALAAMDRYTLDAPVGDNRLVIGYGNISAGAIDDAVRQLARAANRAG